MVNQVRIVAILMIVQGALASLMGVLLAAVGPFMMTMFSLSGAPKTGPQAPPPGMQNMMTILGILYVVMGCVVLGVGVINIIAGIRAYRFRGRTFALVALFLNIIPVFTTYCAPTSIGIMVYGLIVFFQADVAKAFELASRGMSPEEIRERFERKRLRRDRDEEDEDERAEDEEEDETKWDRSGGDDDYGIRPKPER